MDEFINNEKLVSNVFKNHIKHKPHGLYLKEPRRNDDSGSNALFGSNACIVFNPNRGCVVELPQMQINQHKSNYL